MSEIAGTFIFNGKPMNGATAKLWSAAGFVSPPEQDDDEPDGEYQLGDDITTGIQYGGDGAFRFSDISPGEFYISVEYDNHRAWFFYDHINLSDLLTTEGDMVIRGESSLEVVSAGTEAQKLKTVGGVPEWA